MTAGSPRRLLTVVMPARNEAATIGAVIAAVPQEPIRALGFATEVLVVDNNSTDATGAEAAAAGARVVRESRPGYGSALKRGLREARGDVVVTIDADGSHPPEILPALLARFTQEECWFITGTRFAGMSWRQRLQVRQIGNTVLSWTARLLFRLPTTDSQCGLWMMRKAVALEAQALADDFAFSQEIKILAWRRHRDGWQEVPIPPVQRQGGTSQLRPFRDGLRIGQRLLVLRLRGGPRRAPATAGPG